MSMLLPREVLIEPYYEIYINGTKLSDDLKKYITEVQVEESDSEADLGRISIADKDMIFSNMTSLTEKAPIKIYMGHKKSYRLMLDGEITHIEAEYSEDGICYLTIGAIDKTNKMTYIKKSRVFKNKTISDVVRQIAKEYGFTPKVQSTTPVLEQITQDDETDAQFLAKLADEEAFKFYVIAETNTLYFGDKITDAKIKDTLYYNSGDNTIISFSPMFVEKNKPENVKSSNSSTSSKTSSKTYSKISSSTGKKVTKSSSSGKPSTSSNALPKKSSNTGIMVTSGKVVGTRVEKY